MDASNPDWMNPEKDMETHVAAGLEAGMKIRDHLFGDRLSEDRPLVRIPYSEYEELMRLKAQASSYGTPQPASEPPKTYGLDVTSTEFGTYEFSRVVEVRMAENGILIVMGISPVDNETITAIAAFHPGSWHMWQMASRDEEIQEEG
jgi:hypothetical protein